MTEEGAPPAPAITTPFWDGVLVGGLSLGGMSAALAFVHLTEGFGRAFDKSDWVVLSILVNSTHFMASYRLLYTSRDPLRTSPWAALYVPVLLGVLLVWRVGGPGDAALADGILLVASLYLAVHYTGQAWGMVSVFARLAGVEFEPGERRAIRSGMFTLLVVHLLLATSGMHPPESWIAKDDYVALYRIAFRTTCAFAALTLVAGAIAFGRARWRGEPVPARCVLPWLSLYLWYPTWFLVPGGPLFVQLAHALQYLSFPLRVEANRYVARGGAESGRHVALVYLALVVVGAIVLKGPPLASRLIGQGWYSTVFVRDAFTTFVLLVNIHHFFIDGALWKLRNPEVRRELFAHVRPG